MPSPTVYECMYVCLVLISVQAFVKRMLHVCACHSTPFTCGCLVLLSEVSLLNGFYVYMYCLGCAVLLCFVVCVALLASFFLPSHLSCMLLYHTICCELYGKPAKCEVMCN